MGVEENKKVVRRYIDAVFNNPDYISAKDLIHEDFFGESGKTQGIEANVKNLLAQGEKTTDVRYDLLELIAEEDKVVAVSMVSGTDVGGYFSDPPTNKKYEAKVTAVYTVKDGKIANGDIVFNFLPIYQQIGVLPSTEEILQAYSESQK